MRLASGSRSLLIYSTSMTDEEPPPWHRARPASALLSQAEEKDERGRLPTPGHALRETPQSPLARRAGSARLRSPLPAPTDGLRSCGLRRKARYRDHQYLVRYQPVPRPSADPRGGGEARYLASGGLSHRTPCDAPFGTLREADDDALSQLPGDGGGGAAAQSPDRWRRPVGRLRQDHPGTSDGGDLHGVALHLRAGWADAARQLARPSPGLRFGCLEVLG